MIQCPLEPAGCDRLVIRCQPPDCLGTRPTGFILKLENGKVSNGPSIRPKLTSLSIFFLVSQDGEWQILGYLSMNNFVVQCTEVKNHF